MALLTKDQILGADDLDWEDVPCPEWGGDVRVRALTGRERDRYEMKAALSRKDGTEMDFRSELVVRTIIDENGERLFTDKEMTQLAAKSATPIDRLFDVVRRLSGMEEETVEEDAEGFVETPGADSPSA